MPKTKSKQQKLSIDRLGEVAQQAGLILMTAAVTFGMVEMGDHPSGRIVLPSQFALVPIAEHENDNNAVRRERDEAAPHYVSYSAYQRTPGRSGRA